MEVSENGDIQTGRFRKNGKGMEGNGLSSFCRKISLQ
jgi:hypothetical protein